MIGLNFYYILLVYQKFIRSKHFIRVWSYPFQTNEADAVTLDAGLVFEAGLQPYNLKPVVAEFYESQVGKFFLGTQERVCCSCSLLVDTEFVLFRQVMEIKDMSIPHWVSVGTERLLGQRHNSRPLGLWDD